MNLNCTTKPTTEPVTWAELQAHARIVGNDDQTYGESLITAAREYAEQVTGLAIMPQTWTMKLDNLWYDGSVVRGGAITVPRPPLVSVSSIAYVNDTGTTSTIAASVYTANIASSPGRIYEAYGQSWPLVRDQEAAVTVVYVAGYATAAAVPKSIKQAILILANHWYANREPVASVSINAVPMSVESLLGMHQHGYQF